MIEMNLLQISGETIGDLKVVEDMHQRKSEMAKNADAFIALPGINSSSCKHNFTSILTFICFLI